MNDKKKDKAIRLRHITAILEIGEILSEVLTPEERQALQASHADIDRVEAKRRYRWNNNSK